MVTVAQEGCRVPLCARLPCVCALQGPARAAQLPSSVSVPHAVPGALSQAARAGPRCVMYVGTRGDPAVLPT